MNIAQLKQKLDELVYNGVLYCGGHDADEHRFCALEFDSALRGRTQSDEPITMPDLRPLNDGPWSSNQARTEALLPVMAALWDWDTWDKNRKNKWLEIVALETVRKIISKLPGLSDQIAEQCRQAANYRESCKIARKAQNNIIARRGYILVAADASLAVTVKELHNPFGAAQCARYAAKATLNAQQVSADAVLGIACQIWIDAVAQSGEEEKF